MIYLLSCEVADLPPPSGPLPEPSPEQIGDFYVRLGMAIAAWQFVEAALVHVYAAAVGTQNYEALAASFHVPASFRARLDMTDEAVKRSADARHLLSEWGKIYTRAQKKGKRRNELAHAIVIFEPARKRPQDQLYLAQNVSDPSRFSPGFAPGTIITQSELEAMVGVFEQVRSELFSFGQKLPPPIRPPLTSPAPSTS